MKRYQTNMSTLLILVVIAALVSLHARFLIWFVKGWPVDREYVYIEHKGKTIAIDRRVWPDHYLNHGATIPNQEP